MHTQFPNFRRLSTAAALALGINMLGIGALMLTPTRGQTLLLAANPVTTSVATGLATIESVKLGAEMPVAHLGRDLRHLQRDTTRGLHHAEAAVSNRLAQLVETLRPAC
jgi:hypothetical protein